VSKLHLLLLRLSHGVMIWCLQSLQGCCCRSAYFTNRENHPLCDQSLVGFSVVLLDGTFLYSLHADAVGNGLYLMEFFNWFRIVQQS
jgi:hypothetical protein